MISASVLSAVLSVDQPKPAWWESGWTIPAVVAIAVGVTTITVAVRNRMAESMKKALGPDAKAVREALTDARRFFEEVTGGGKPAHWFMDEERREVGRKLVDLAGRVGDEQLQCQLQDVADTCNRVFADSPPKRDSLAYANLPDRPSADEVRTEDLDRINKQVTHAHAGIKRVEEAVKQLNTLEKRVTGR